MFSLQICIALLLDLVLGDPPWFPHPVRFIGKMIQLSEKFSRAVIRNPLIAGAITVIIVLAATFGILTGLLQGADTVHPLAQVVLGILILYLGIACKDLMVHADRVYALLQENADINETRKALGMIVGRDTASLDEDDILQGDGRNSRGKYGGWRNCTTVLGNSRVFGRVKLGVIANRLGSGRLLLYKSINTMDSMIAYKNEKYLYFGRVAARVDDIANFVPARLSGICVIVAAFFMKFDYRRAAAVFVLDRLHHSSPNAGHTGAAVAGALGLRLGGTSRYNGVEVEKEFIGTADNCPSPEDIKHTEKLVLGGAALFLVTMLLFRSVLV